MIQYEDVLSDLDSDVIDRELLNFLDFIDDNFSDTNIIPADKEQLLRIASLVEGVISD